MAKARDPAVTADRPVLPWRMVAGAFLHFGILAYILVVPLLCVLNARPGSSVEQLLSLALSCSGAFLLGFLVLGATLTLGAALLDPLLRGRRRARIDLPDITASRACQALANAGQAARQHLDETTNRLFGALYAGPWDHRDPRCQALARDTEELIVRSAQAAAATRADGRADINAAAQAALARLQGELDALAIDRAQAAQDRARAIANYVAARYPALDSSMGAD